MTPTYRSAAPTTPLTPTEIRVIEQLAAGATIEEVAQALNALPATVSRHMSQVGWKVRTASRPARIHIALATGEAKPPTTSLPRPEFSPDEQRLLLALAQHAVRTDIARAAHVHPSSLRTRVTALLRRAGASNTAHLIGLAHAWGFLESKTGTTTHTPEDSPPAG
ncbi:LuxR C-terminal-related transcriptional regulator [Streptomyces diacarni]|uniref:LuxR C-terminal-related transcriptional regulator n=1 Tax=Streptomyces diacarni TaxID=2800381 RepID=UPI0033C8FA2B